MVKRKEKSDQNAVAELTREGLYKENKWLWKENRKLNEEIENHKQNIMQDELEIIPKLEEENKKLKSDLAFERTMLDNVRAEYDSLQNVIKELKEENEDLKQIIKLSKSYEEGKNKLKEVYIKNTAEFLDKKFPKINGFMEEDTLQELRDLGKI